MIFPTSDVFLAPTDDELFVATGSALAGVFDSCSALFWRTPLLEYEDVAKQSCCGVMIEAVTSIAAEVGETEPRVNGFEFNCGITDSDKPVFLERSAAEFASLDDRRRLPSFRPSESLVTM